MKVEKIMWRGTHFTASVNYDEWWQIIPLQTHTISTYKYKYYDKLGMLWFSNNSSIFGMELPEKLTGYVS